MAVGLAEREWTLSESDSHTQPLLSVLRTFRFVPITHTHPYRRPHRCMKFRTRTLVTQIQYVQYDTQYDKTVSMAVSMNNITVTLSLVFYYILTTGHGQADRRQRKRVVCWTNSRAFTPHKTQNIEITSYIVFVVALFPRSGPPIRTPWCGKKGLLAKS